jgi:hypothetical protein
LAVLQCLNVCITTLVTAGILSLTAHVGPAVMMIPPAVYVLSPVVGCAAIAQSTPMLHRVAASLEVLCLLPTAIVVVAGVVGTVVGPFDYQIGVIFPIALLLVKLAVLRLTNTRVALLELYQEAQSSCTPAVAYVRELMADVGSAPLPGGGVDTARTAGRGSGSGHGSASDLAGMAAAAGTVAGATGGAGGGGASPPELDDGGGLLDGGLGGGFVGNTIHAPLPSMTLTGHSHAGSHGSGGFGGGGAGSAGAGGGRRHVTSGFAAPPLPAASQSPRGAFYGPGGSGVSALLDFASPAGSLGSPP